LADWLLPHAIENDRLAHLADLTAEECRSRRIILPPPRTLERLCVEVRYRARREVQRRLTDGLSAEQRQQLDALTQRREETSQSWLAWLRQMPEATKLVAMLSVIERLDHVRAIDLDSSRGHRVHRARLVQLAREASRTTAQRITEYERQRRHATLVAVTLDLVANLTDQSIDLFDRLIGTMFRKVISGGWPIGISAMRPTPSRCNAWSISNCANRWRQSSEHGVASSSDGQFFRAGGLARDAGRLNAHYGDELGSKFYTYISDRYAPFHTG
jgi:hypothetical protein